MPSEVHAVTDTTKTIDECLSRRSTVQALLSRADMLREIQTAIRGLLGPAGDGVRVANIRDGTLVLFVDSAAVGTRIRFGEAQILGLVRDRFGHGVWKLQVKVRAKN